jgi:hypothetical protein
MLADIMTVKSEKRASATTHQTRIALLAFKGFVGSGPCEVCGQSFPPTAA